MKVYDICPKAGRIWSIEVPSSVGRRRLHRAIAAIPDVRVLKGPGLFSWLRDRPFLRFELGGLSFLAESKWPSGDRFEIGPNPAGCTEELLIIREALLAS